jgi:predicted nucleic acid binding AN1-type Zn finger protein
MDIESRVKQCHKQAMTWNGNHAIYKNGDLGGYYCFTHIRLAAIWMGREIRRKPAVKIQNDSRLPSIAYGCLICKFLYSKKHEFPCKIDK